MFYNTPNGLQLETENGWTISISLAGVDVQAYCEIAVWPTGKDSQDNWVRWGANMAEPPDYPIYSKVLGDLTATELITTINRLSAMSKGSVVSNKWLSKGLTMEVQWR